MAVKGIRCVQRQRHDLGRRIFDGAVVTEITRLQQAALDAASHYLMDGSPESRWNFSMAIQAYEREAEMIAATNRRAGRRLKARLLKMLGKRHATT